MAKETRKLICIRCPRGCEVLTTIDGGNITEIQGNVCRLGETYAREEITDPRRLVTSTVRVKGGKYPLVPVWTNESIPKDRIFDLMAAIRDIELTAPVTPDTMVLKDALGLGVDVVVSGSVKAAL